MKNYYNSKLELDNAKDRVVVLKHDIEIIEEKLIKITSTIKDNVSSGGFVVQSKIHTLTIQKIAKEEELKELLEEIDYLEPIVKRMGERVEAMVGLEKEVFELFYKENIEVKDIALKKNYSAQRIYQILDKIKEKLGIE